MFCKWNEIRLSFSLFTSLIAEKCHMFFWHSFKNTIIANFYCILLKTPGTELLLLNETNGNKYPKIPLFKTTQRIHFSIELIDEKNKKKLEIKINDWIHNLILKLVFGINFQIQLLMTTRKSFKNGNMLLVQIRWKRRTPKEKTSHKDMKFD